MFHDDDIPAIDRTGSAHEHSENVRGGEDSRFILLSQFLNDWVGGGGDIVRRSVERLQFALCISDWRLVICAIVVVEKAIIIDVFSISRFKVEFGQSIKVYLFFHQPIWPDINRRISIALWLVVVSPAKSPSSSTASAASVVVELIAALGSAPALSDSLVCPSCASLCRSSLPSASEDCSTSTAESAGLCCCASVVYNRERGFIFCQL